MATKKRKAHSHADGSGASSSFADEGTRTGVPQHHTQARTVMAPFREERDTDEDDRGVALSDAELNEFSSQTMTDLPVLGGHMGEDELLDLGSLGEPSLAGDAAMESRAPSVMAGGGGAEAPERRLTATLLKIFARRREEIGLSLDQLARLSGISLVLLDGFEHPRPGLTITYDQVVVLSRVLGVAPEELPGLRRKETRAHLGEALAELERTLLAAPLLRFEGSHGERFGGDVERAAASKAFTVRIEDDSLSPTLPRGAVLGFLSGGRPRQGGILLLRHRRSSMLAMRRYEPPAYSGLMPWQPSYVVGGEWHLCGSLEVLLPSR